MDTQRTIAIVALVVGAVVCVVFGNETIAGVLAGGAVGALVPPKPSPPEPPPVVLPPPITPRKRTGRTPPRGVPTDTLTPP